MWVADFQNKMIDIDEEVPDILNSDTVPIMVIDARGRLLSVKSVDVESHETGGHTIWIRTEEY